MIKNATTKGLLVLVVTFILSIPALAQYSASEVKSLEKAKSYYDKGKYDKAIATLKKVQEEHVYDNNLWERRCAYEYDRYQVQLFADYTEILKKASKGVTTFDFSKLKSTAYHSELVGACTTATLICPQQENASWMLHAEFIEPSVDTAVSDEAIEAYNKGSDDFSNGSFSAAIRAYERALKIDSNYFEATHKIGICYARDEKYEKAIPYFKKAILLEPNMLNPRQNLVDCYMTLRSWQDAYSACVDGIIVYPDIRYFVKMDEICNKLGKTFDRHWMKRLYLPNMIAATDQANPSGEPWMYYRQAKDKVFEFCTEDGIIKKKIEFTDQKYLESYSWEFMLKKTSSDNDDFAFAREVQKAGYLDCYAMVSMYHIFFSQQYIDFSKNNTERIRTYINTYLVK